MNTQSTIIVSGDSGTEYTLTIGHHKKGYFFRCSCTAGQNAQLCKHRLRLLLGDEGGIHISDAEAMDLLEKLRFSPEILDILDQKQKIEREQEKLKKNLAKIKKQMGRMLEHGTCEN